MTLYKWFSRFFPESFFFFQVNAKIQLYFTRLVHASLFVCFLYVCLFVYDSGNFVVKSNRGPTFILILKFLDIW